MRSRHQEPKLQGRQGTNHVAPWAYFFSTMRDKLLDALVTMGCPPMDVIMSCCAPHGLPYVHATDTVRWPIWGSTWWVGIRSQEGFE